MANNNAFKSNVAVSPSPASIAIAAQDNGTTSAVNAPTSSNDEASFVWGEDPTTRYIVIETTVSGTSYKAPQPNVQGAVKKLANVWPGALYWTETKKDANGLRLFTKLNAMVMKRDSNGLPILDEEGELTWGEGIQVTLYKQGLSKKAQAQIAELESAKAIKPELASAIDNMIAGLQASAGWVAQKLDSKSFVSGLCGSGDALAPVTMYLNMAFSPKESAAFVKSIAKLAQAGQPGLLRFYIPMERISMPKENWEPIKAKVNNNLIDLKHPNTGETITGPVFSWGNRTQPIAKVELIAGKFLPSSEGMDRVLSVAETDRRVAAMERNWEADEEQDFKLWAEALKGRFVSEGNQWAHKAGALPKRNGGAYASTCTMWEDAAESSAKLDKWSESLRSLVNVKPRLTEENQKGNDNKLFSTEACEAIIASAKAQSIQPWVDFVNSIGGGNTIAPVAAPVTVTPIVTPAVVEEPKSSEAALSDEAYLAAIMAMREEQGLDELEEEEDLCADFFTGNIQE